MTSQIRFASREFFDALSDEIVVLDGDGTIIAANDAWRRFCDENDGNSATYYVGTRYVDSCSDSSGEDGVETTQVPVLIRKLLADGTGFRCEYPCHSPTERRWFEMTASSYDQGGERFAIIGHRNITIRKVGTEEAAEAHLNTEALSALVAGSNDAILSYDLDGRIATWNGAAEKLYGYSRDEAIGQSLELLYPPDWPKRIEEYRDEILSGKLSSFEAVRMAKSGELRTVWISAAPIRGVDGAFAMVSNIHRDVTEIRRVEKARDIIAREVVHRAKNMLTVVNAIHRQTARGATSLEDFNQRFGARIQSLANSTELLVTGEWRPVAISDLIRSQTETFFDGSAASVTVDGPPVVLQPQAVQVLGMALHELSTNSAKHGALRAPGGRIELRWQLKGDGDGRRLDVGWIETGLQSPADSGANGFGSTVLTDLSATMLNADAHYALVRDRVTWTIQLTDELFSFGDPT